MTARPEAGTEMEQQAQEEEEKGLMIMAVQPLALAHLRVRFHRIRNARI